VLGGIGKEVVVGVRLKMFSSYFVLFKKILIGKYICLWFMIDYKNNNIPGLIGILIMQIGLIFTMLYPLL